jgi:hypothetical protein
MSFALITWGCLQFSIFLFSNDPIWWLGPRPKILKLKILQHTGFYLEGSRSSPLVQLYSWRTTTFDKILVWVEAIISCLAAMTCYPLSSTRFSSIRIQRQHLCQKILQEVSLFWQFIMWIMAFLLAIIWRWLVWIQSKFEKRIWNYEWRWSP